MRNQLVLIDPPAADWRLDERTREVGRQGLAAARAALQEASRNALPTDAAAAVAAARPAAA
jgi:hypothetical protein